MVCSIYEGEKMLICKNVIVNGRRTSMRLDKETWISLSDICSRERINVHELCSRIDSFRGQSGLSSSVRLFVLSYFRNVLQKYQTQVEIPSEPILDVILAIIKD